MNSIFVCFIGIDGSGKTTLANMLVEIVRQHGTKCRYVHSLYDVFLAKPLLFLARSLFLRKRDRSRNYKEYSGKKKGTLRNHPLLACFYKYLLILDYLPQLAIKVKIPLMLGRNIISDRYVYDMAINLGLDFNYSPRRIKHAIDRYFLIFPRPDRTFLVDVPEKLAYQRKDDTPSVDYLKERRELYLTIGREFGVTVLDGSRNLEQLEQELRRIASEFE